MPAETALGHAIEVVSGREEARLIYLGVAHAQPPKPGELRLVIDIGGGSTECIIGAGFEAIERESLQVGCVATTRRFFADGKLSRKRWKRGADRSHRRVPAVRRHLPRAGLAGGARLVGHQQGDRRDLRGDEAHQGRGHRRGAAAGARSPAAGRDASTTSTCRACRPTAGRSSPAACWCSKPPSPRSASSAWRSARPRCAKACCTTCSAAAARDDPREASVAALMQRYGIDAAQAARVEAHGAAPVRPGRRRHGSSTPTTAAMLARAARLHELGLAIAHSQYHVHGAYVLEHSDIAGFSQQEQQFLAALVRTHRRGIPKSAFDALPDRLLARAQPQRRAAAPGRAAAPLARSRPDPARGCARRRRQPG